jgi:hypothetical protein
MPGGTSIKNDWHRYLLSLFLISQASPPSVPIGIIKIGPPACETDSG